MAGIDFGDGRLWELGKLIDSGGVGLVHAATSQGVSRPHAIKLVSKQIGSRELIVLEYLHDRPNIVPVLGVADLGADWAFLMPKADRSLRKHLNILPGAFSEADALPILIDIACGIAELSNLPTYGSTELHVIHRDLKPENVLLLEGVWCLSDFGMSRRTDRHVGKNSKRHLFTPQYAAPEQWTYKTTSPQTDVYAFGIIAFELLMGGLPYKGPDFGKQHLDGRLPDMNGVPGRLATLILECLNEQPGARPSPSELKERLRWLDQEKSVRTLGVGSLQSLNHAEAVRRDKERREAQRKQEEIDSRKSLIRCADLQLHEISFLLKSTVYENLEYRKEMKDSNGGWCIQVRPGGAMLVFSGMCTKRFGSFLPFEVLCHAYISVGDPSAMDRPHAGRAHSLWYCDAQVRGRYRWYEVAFARTSAKLLLFEKDCVGDFLYEDLHRLFSPFAVPPALAGAEQCKHEYEISWPLTPLVGSGLDDFVDRWSMWFGDAGQGSLPPLPVREVPKEVQSTELPHRRPGGRTWKILQSIMVALLVVLGISVAVYMVVQLKAKSDALRDTNGRMLVEEQAKGGNRDCYVVAAGGGTAQESVNNGKRYSCDAVPVASKGVGDPYWIVVTIKGVNTEDAHRNGVLLTCRENVMKGGSSTDLVSNQAPELRAVVGGLAGGSGDAPSPLACAISSGATVLRSFTVTLKQDPSQRFGS